MNDVAIRAEGLSKVFKLPHEKQTSLKSKLINFSKNGYEMQEALKDVSFEVKKGEFFGIVGRNGSGKSTLLKLLAGIYSPTTGNIRVNGRLTPFIELGVGFNPELTGRENVFLNGALLGFNRSEMLAMYKDIVEFAELSKFMDQKLKNYSSGMQVRLAFSIAIRAQSDILLIDEVLAVGDVAFQQKCYDYFENLKMKGTTVIFVSHDMEVVKRFCDRAAVIDRGGLKFLGKPIEAADIYIEENEGETISKLSESNKHWKKSTPLEIKILDTAGKAADSFKYGDSMVICLKWDKHVSPKPKNAGIAVFNEGRMVFGSNTGATGLKEGANSVSQKIKLNLGPGKYTTVAALFDGNNLSKAYIFESRGPEFFIKSSVKGSKNWEGITRLENEWVYEK